MRRQFRVSERTRVFKLGEETRGKQTTSYSHRVFSVSNSSDTKRVMPLTEYGLRFHPLSLPNPFLLNRTYTNPSHPSHSHLDPHWNPPKNIKIKRILVCPRSSCHTLSTSSLHRIPLPQQRFTPSPKMYSRLLLSFLEKFRRTEVLQHWLSITRVQMQ